MKVKFSKYISNVQIEIYPTGRVKLISPAFPHHNATSEVAAVSSFFHLSGCVGAEDF